MITTIPNDNTTARWKILNATALKLIAAALMFLDHIHQMYISEGAPIWLNMLGRPVFPMFLFMAAEGFHYTRNRKKYLKRLLLASWGMTIITTTLEVLVPSPDIVLMNNAFSTFFVTGLYIQCWDWLFEGIRQRKAKLIAKSILCGFIPVLCVIPFVCIDILLANENIPTAVIHALVMLALLFPNLITVEGGFIFVLLGLLFYIFREKRIIQIAVLLFVSGLVYFLEPDGIQWMMCGASIPMLLYNGQLGRGMKYFFYVFYPAHICFLYLTAVLL